MEHRKRKPNLNKINVQNQGWESKKEIDKIRKQLGLEPLKTTTRKCLRCEKSFKSYGYNNRMCMDCASYGQSIDSNYEQSTDF